jgi:ABC-2 type transport system permease protein
MKKAFIETWVQYIHYLKIELRSPFWILASLFQPVCYLYLFAPLLKNVSGAAEAGAGADAASGAPAIGSINSFAPGLLVMVALFGTLYVGYGMIEYLRSGVIERLRVTTASRLSLLLGLVLRDVTTLLVQTAIVFVLSLPLGLVITPLGVGLTAVLMVLVALTISPASYSIALMAKSEDALGPILNFFSQPLLLLSGVLLPLTLAPLWLRTLSDANPLKYVVDASRAIFQGDLANPAVWKSFAIMTVLVVLSFAWSMRQMRKATE